MPSLSTPRLRLRRWKVEDQEPFARINADPEVMEHFPGPLDPGASDLLLNRIEQHFDEYGYGLWALETKDAMELIGFCGLAVPNFETEFTPAVEIGWRLGRNHWGNGYATEAAGAVLDYGFGEVGIDPILSWALPANHRSIRVMERIGLQPAPELDFDHPRFVDDDRLRRHVVYRITREEWAALRKTP
jgi:RimJ/RimL family protein N-acetyltransferase